MLIKEEELKRLMDRQKEAEKDGKIFYSERQSYSSEVWDTRKMAIDFLESKLFNYEQKKTEAEQNNDLQLMNDFFQEEIGYLNQDNLTITANELKDKSNELKDKFVEFLRSGREIDLTHQELTLFVSIIDDAQVLMRNEKDKDKKVANDRLSSIEKKNPKLINEMKAQTAIYRSKMQIKQSIMPGNYRHLNLNTQIEKYIKPEFKQNIQLNNINIDNFNKDVGKINLNNNHIDIKKSNNYNTINNEYDRDYEKKEDNIDENFKIDDFIKQSTNKNQKPNIKEGLKLKKIDVKKNDNMRRGTQIVNNINNINNDNFNNSQNKTFVNKYNPKNMLKKVSKLDNPRTVVMKNKLNIWKNNNEIGNQSMIVPNNITINTNVVGSKKALDIMQNMFSKKSINNEKDKQINNKK